MNRDVAKYRSMRAEALASMMGMVITKSDDEQINQIFKDTIVFLNETKEHYTAIAVGEEKV